MLAWQVDMPISQQPENITTLVDHARREPAAFSAIYDRYVGPIFRYIYSRVGNTPDAEDLTAQTFLSALESLPRYRERGTFSAWLFAIAHSKIMDHFRRKDPGTLLEDQSPLPVVTSQVELADQATRLAPLIHALDEHEQELIRLRFVADLSFAEMAALLNKKEDTVKKSLYRLLARLKGQMEAENV